MKDIEVLEFRKINTDDQYDDFYNDLGAWSRVYEYRLVLDKMREYFPLTAETYIHNSSWGWQDLHIKFKDEIDRITVNAIHTDINNSSLPKTDVWNITKKPPKKYLEKFDIVLNISTVEEVDYDHMKVFNNLLSQVKVGGILICTFDLPGLQLEKFENRFGKKLGTTENDITGANSKLQNLNYSGLSCGYFVIRKMESTLKQDSNFFKRLLHW